MCLPSLMAPHLNFSITYIGSFKFQIEINRHGFHLQTTPVLVISRCCFAEDARAELLFSYPLDLLFWDVLVAVAVVACLRFLTTIGHDVVF